jgi:hypothetical protein
MVKEPLALYTHWATKINNISLTTAMESIETRQKHSVKLARI